MKDKMGKAKAAAISLAKKSKIGTAVALLVFISAIYWGAGHVFSASGGAKYAVASADTGSIVSSVSGTGQISSSDQVDVTAKASGQILSVDVTAGQAVKEGQALAHIDPGSAYYDLQSAQISYKKLTTEDPETLRNDQNAVSDAQANLEDSYVSARNALTSASTDMTNVMQSLSDLYDCNTGYMGDCNNYSIGADKRNLERAAETAWYAADKAQGEFGAIFQNLAPDASHDQLDQAIDKGYSASLMVADAAKKAQDALIYLRDNAENSSDRDAATSVYNTVTPLVSSATSMLSSVASARSSVQSSKRSLENAQTALDNLSNPNDLDVQSSVLALKQKELALSNYTVKAPFDGIVASVAAKKGDQAAGTIATIISGNKVAEISLNEVDAAKVKVGDKATLTFDALDGVALTGKVAEMDLIGTVTQGVVSYKVKIALDADNPSVRPGMTVSADITTDVQENVVRVPISAIKTVNGKSFIQVPAAPVSGVSADKGNQTALVALSSAPKMVPVETGASDDRYIEIVSGLNPGDQYVAKTVSSGAKTTQASAPSLFSGASGAKARAGGGNQSFRVGG